MSLAPCTLNNGRHAAKTTNRSTRFWGGYPRQGTCRGNYFVLLFHFLRMSHVHQSLHPIAILQQLAWSDRLMYSETLSEGRQSQTGHTCRCIYLVFGGCHALWHLRAILLFLQGHFVNPTSSVRHILCAVQLSHAL